MYIPSISISPRSMVENVPPLDKSSLSLDTLGVAGVFGGDEAVSAMATVHVYEGRRWLGWYNSPGSYQIARRYGLLAKSRFFDSFSPGVHTDPTTLLGPQVGGWKGPKFRAVHSDTIIEESGYLASLFMKECAAREGEAVRRKRTEAVQAVGVTIAELGHDPGPPSQTYPKHINAYSPVFAAIPIAVSTGTCITCGAFHDWYSFSSILLGIVVSGISCLVISSGQLVFNHPDPMKGCSPGDGILSSDREIVLLKGPEGAVDSIIRGWFSLSFPSEPHYKYVEWCSFLLTTQFIAQFFLVPQCSLFGQIMFIVSLGVSWIYNSWLSLSKEKIQRDMLFNDILQKPALTKYTFGTRTTMAVFVLLVLQLEEPSKILDALLPTGDNCRVWRRWKETVVRRILDKEKLDFVDSDWQLDGFTQQERSLLETLYGDAQAAYSGYRCYAPSNL